MLEEKEGRTRGEPAELQGGGASGKADGTRASSPDKENEEGDFKRTIGSIIASSRAWEHPECAGCVNRYRKCGADTYKVILFSHEEGKNRTRAVWHCRKKTKKRGGERKEKGGGRREERGEKRRREEKRKKKSPPEAHIPLTRYV